MARRKRELLDLLRERPPQSGSAKGPSEDRPTRAKPSAPSQKPVSAPPQRPSTLAAKPPSQSGRSAGSKSGGPWAYLKIPTLVVAVFGLVALGLAMPRLFGGNSSLKAAAGDPPFAILAAQYASSRKDIAIATAQAMKVQLGDQVPVQLIRYQASEQELLELWIGEATEAIALEALLLRIQAAQVPTDRNNSQPFATALIDRRRRVNAD